MHTIIRSASKEVVLGHDQKFCIIGEHINPTGRRIFQEQHAQGTCQRSSGTSLRRWPGEPWSSTSTWVSH